MAVKIIARSVQLLRIAVILDNRSVCTLKAEDPGRT
jgi:hypothetical protein